MKILASRSDIENFLFLIITIVIIIGILACYLLMFSFPYYYDSNYYWYTNLLLANVFFPIHSSEFTIGQTAIGKLDMEIYQITH